MAEAEKLFRGPTSPTLEPIAAGVWLLRGDLRHGMNVYLLEEQGGGVTAFDAGTRPMLKALRAAAQRFGGLKRIVLGHSHTDHRGTAPQIGVPVLCHADEVSYAESPGWPDYWDMSQLPVAWARWIYPTLHRRWGVEPVKIDGTVSEGDEIAGFRVLDFPGHAPGLIGLWRQSDRLALVSDTVYFLDTTRLKPLPELDRPGVRGREAMVPFHVWNFDHDQARASVRRLAGLRPATVCAGHFERLAGDPDAVGGVIGEAAERG